MNLADKIRKNKTIIKHGGHFEVSFHDGSSITEHECSWRDFSGKKEVKNIDRIMTVHLSDKVKKVGIYHENCKTELEVPEGCQVYHAIQSETFFNTRGEASSKIVGKVVGIVKDGEVIEERFLDGINVLGFKK